MWLNGYSFAKLHFDRDVLARKYIKYLMNA